MGSEVSFFNEFVLCDPHDLDRKEKAFNYLRLWKYFKLSHIDLGDCEVLDCAEEFIIKEPFDGMLSFPGSIGIKFGIKKK